VVWNWEAVVVVCVGVFVLIAGLSGIAEEGS
jgi:hypothetical protein